MPVFLASLLRPAAALPVPIPAARGRTARALLATAAMAWLTTAPARADEPGRISIASPNGQLSVEFTLSRGAARYQVCRAGRPVLAESRLGLERADADFTSGLQLTSVAPTEIVQDRYEILTSKRRLNAYRATRKVLHLENSAGHPLDLAFQVSDDGVAFRYVFPDVDRAMHRLRSEATSFHFLPGTRAWLQPIAVARTGFAGSNPSYEEYYEKDVPVGTSCPTGAGWVYPALFRSGDTWLLVSESGLGRAYCGTRLRGESPDGEYSIGFADSRETVPGGAAAPESTLPWATPWRLIVVGDLRTVVESNLGIDVADRPGQPPTDAELDGPGKAAWSWPLLGDPNTTFEVQKRFVDYAADMGWRYTLVDALWDQQIGYDKLRELVVYATTRNVRILLWYNSAGDWNTTPQTPRGRLLTHADRVQEFERLKAMGVAGLKVDFFGGDGQSMIAYYQDLLEDAASYGLLMNFHGATLPRGWSRTYPNLMTMEAVRGLEFITFEQRNADEEPTHAAMLPFTRNVFDPMDFTPMVLDRINGRIERRTTAGFELALSVLFTSGIQHYAEIPEGMAKAPDYVRDFLRHVPSVWDDVAFLDGEPGSFVVIARRSDDHWFIAGINGLASERKLELDVRRLGCRSATLIQDGGADSLGFQRETVRIVQGRLPVTLRAHGGFVLATD